MSHCIGLDFLGADDASVKLASTVGPTGGGTGILDDPTLANVVARIPKAELEAFQSDLLKKVYFEFDTSASAEEQRKMAERTLASMMNATEEQARFVLKYAKPEEKPSIARAVDEWFKGASENPEMTPEQKQLVASTRDRIKAAAGEAPKVGETLAAAAASPKPAGKAKSIIYGLLAGSAVGAAIAAFMWRRNRTVAMAAGGLAPVVGTAAAAVVGSRKPATPSVETKPSTSQADLAIPVAPVVPSAPVTPATETKAKKPRSSAEILRERAAEMRRKAAARKPKRQKNQKKG